MKDRKYEPTRGISPPLDTINQQTKVAKVKVINFKLKINFFSRNQNQTIEDKSNCSKVHQFTVNTTNLVHRHTRKVEINNKN